MAFSEHGLSAIATKLGTPLMRDSYILMIELRVNVELKDTIGVAILKLVGERLSIRTVHVENSSKAFGSLTTTPIAEMINDIERQMLDEKLVLVNDDGKLLKMLMIWLMWIVIVKWTRETYIEDQYDDDDFNDYGLTDAQSKFANAFDISLHGVEKELSYFGAAAGEAFYRLSLFKALNALEIPHSNLFPPLDNHDPTLLNNSEMAAEGNDDIPVPDLQTMEELCQPSLNGRGGPIALIAIQATNFGLKNDMIQQSIKVNEVTDDALRLYLFPHSLTHHATAWFDRLPRNSINTFEQMAKMFLGKYFPPSMVTKLINEITNFRQRPDELLFEAWEHYKLSIDRCLNHNMLPVTQIDTFYNGLTLRHRDTINAAAGGTFMKRQFFRLTSKSKQLLRTVKLVVVLIPSLIVQPPLARLKTYMLQEPIKGANQGQNQPPAYQPPAYQASVYQGPVHQPQIPQPQVVTTNEFTNFMKANDAILKNIQTNMNSFTNSNLELKNMFGQFMEMNTASSLGSGTLAVVTPIIEPVASPVSAPKPNQRPLIPYPSRLQDQKLRDKANDQREKFFQIFKDLNFNISFVDALILMPKFGPSIKSFLTNKDKLCKLTRTPLNEHCSLVLLKKLPEKLGDPGKFLIPCDFPGMAECLALADLSASINLMPLYLGLLKMSVKVGTFNFPADFVVVDFDADPRVPLILERSFLKTGIALIDVFEGKLTHRVGKEAITINLDQTSRYSAKYNDMTTNRIDVIDMAYKEYSQEVLSFSDVIASGNPTPYCDLIVSTTSSTLTPFENSDLLLEELDAFLALEDDPTSPKELKICKVKSDKSSIDESPEVELKDLPPHLEYTFLEGDDKLSVIIAKDLSIEEKTALITVLKSHKRAIAWKLSNIKACLSHLERMLKRCEGTNLCLNWEKSHFMVKEGIVLGHKISKEGIEVDKAKVDVIAKLPNPKTVKGICNFLGHASFYQRKVQLNELRDQAYENSLIYKEKTKRLHDSKIKDRVFNIGDRVLLFNSRLKIFSGKLKSRRSGPFTISHVFPYGIVELSQPDGLNFKVNGHRLKHYFREDVPKMVVPDL
uniref:Reverse transcriptase domain-containing protein n=1 Tax=Tanacetum cinerariifolium TaxID=118510 RepID=A0A699GJB5_TANCI|nr:reverse transcriptase domain-containing protein [Tanacetum cinerariifolium]